MGFQGLWFKRTPRTRLLPSPVNAGNWKGRNMTLIGTPFSQGPVQLSIVE